MKPGPAVPIDVPSHHSNPPYLQPQWTITCGGSSARDTRSEILACHLRSNTGARRAAVSILQRQGSASQTDISELEDLKLEVGGALYTLTQDTLVEVCDFLNIADPEDERISGQSRSSLISHITRHLERKE